MLCKSLQQREYFTATEKNQWLGIDDGNFIHETIPCQGLQNPL